MTDTCSEFTAELAKRYGEMVFATAYRILGDPDDAEDALQEVFLKLMTASKQASNAGPVDDWGAYLRVVATRCAIDLRRRRSRRTRNCIPLTSEIQDCNLQRPDGLSTRRQKAEALRRAMTGLNERDAMVFSLRHFEDYSYEEIAKLMGISANQVGVILHRARKFLQDVLASEDSEVSRMSSGRRG